MNDTDQKVLAFIRETIAATNVPPTVRELCARFGWASSSTVHARLSRLVREGALTLTRPGRPSAYWPTDVDRCSTCGRTS